MGGFYNHNKIPPLIKMTLPETHPMWLFDDNPNQELRKDVESTLLKFKEIYDELKGDRKLYGQKSVIGEVFTMSVHAYQKRYESEERYIISSVMALLQYEFYSRKLLERFPKDKNKNYLNKIIRYVVPFRKRWKLPSFKLHDNITFETVNFTLDRLKELVGDKKEQI